MPTFTILEAANRADAGFSMDQRAAQALGISLTNMSAEQRERFDQVAPGLGLDRGRLRDYIYDNPQIYYPS